MSATTDNEADILSRIIVPQQPGLTPDAAQFLLSLAFDPSDVDRMNELSRKASQGALSDADQEALNNYERVGHLLGILQSKARTSLKRVTDSPGN